MCGNFNNFKALTDNKKMFTKLCKPYNYIQCPSDSVTVYNEIYC